MVSLGLLGLIAGLTVPSIVASVEKQKTRSVFKEAYQIVTSITQAGQISGDFAGITDWDMVNSSNPQGIVGYVTSKLNYSKQCLATDITSDGCRRGYVGTAANSNYNVHNARWILPNGAKIQAYISNGSSRWEIHNMLWTITAKAYADDMIMVGNNIDSTLIRCNASDSKVTVMGVTINPGQCRGADTWWDSRLNTLLGNS